MKETADLNAHSTDFDRNIMLEIHYNASFKQKMLLKSVMYSYFVLKTLNLSYFYKENSLFQNFYLKVFI